MVKYIIHSISLNGSTKYISALTIFVPNLNENYNNFAGKIAALLFALRNDKNVQIIKYFSDWGM